jgi:3D (Asp-Asp-Asp) domain-containing protein
LKSSRGRTHFSSKLKGVTIISTITLLLTLTLLANPNDPTPPEIAAVPVGPTRSKAKLIPPRPKPKPAPPPAEVFEVTAYTAYEESTGKTPSHPTFGITASGKRVQAGVTAACPPELDFGTWLEIEGVGKRRCDDTGGTIKGKRIDIYMESVNEAIKFGRRNLRVWVLKDAQNAE